MNQFTPHTRHLTHLTHERPDIKQVITRWICSHLSPDILLRKGQIYGASYIDEPVHTSHQTPHIPYTYKARYPASYNTLKARYTTRFNKMNQMNLTPDTSHISHIHKRSFLFSLQLWKSKKDWHKGTKFLYLSLAEIRYSCIRHSGM